MEILIAVPHHVKLRRAGVGRERYHTETERRLAEFNGAGAPPPGQPVQVLCEDHSGTYQLPFACRFVDGEWRNLDSGSIVEATVVGWRLPRA
jgi:hypothetical protein